MHGEIEPKNRRDVRKRSRVEPLADARRIVELDERCSVAWEKRREQDVGVRRRQADKGPERE